MKNSFWKRVWRVWVGGVVRGFGYNVYVFRRMRRGVGRRYRWPRRRWGFRIFIGCLTRSFRGWRLDTDGVGGSAGASTVWGWSARRVARRGSAHGIPRRRGGHRVWAIVGRRAISATWSWKAGSTPADRPGRMRAATRCLNGRVGNFALVSVNPAGCLSCGAVLGQGGSGTRHNAVSADGSRIVFTAPDPYAGSTGSGCWGGEPVQVTRRSSICARGGDYRAVWPETGVSDPSCARREKRVIPRCMPARPKTGRRCSSSAKAS